ncbi:MAG: pullulanase-type alpha-1,6-glucosidase [Rubrivivax sp.]|nr:pullulanase-type alpha-1,6-glucosidase [Rubrivivax sp.]
MSAARLLAVPLLAATLAVSARPAAPPPTLQACAAGHETVLHAAPAGAASTAVTTPARAVWLDARTLRWPGVPADARLRLWHSARGQIVARPGEPVQGADGSLALVPPAAPLPAAVEERFRWVAAGATRALAQPRALDAAMASQWVLVQEDAAGRVIQATHTQAAALLDARFGAAADPAVVPALGALHTPSATTFRVWAPTAQRVALCLHAPGQEAAARLVPLARGAAGTWQARVAGDWFGHTYTYLADVAVRGVGLVRNKVTDPYSLSLNADSRRSWIGRLDDPRTMPPGWAASPQPHPAAARVRSLVDMVIYELHVRDFSIGDTTVPAAHRGTYLGFTHAGSAGMAHLKRLSEAGVTDVHLLPAFDLATVPERGCTTPDTAALAAMPPDSEAQQALVMAEAQRDCFNWGYDPLHFNAPEGSFATDADDGAVRLREFRALVLALHEAGLRVGMDKVYNHTSASGQNPKSVLDRLVPGYYHRLDAEGRVTNSTCCDNTATEHRMMERLMIDSAVIWARDHRIDSFRFDLMGHQPRAAMERLQQAVNKASQRRIDLIGEGWNFGEVTNGVRFVQASQLSLNGSGIATFSDRGRDAARGGGCCDDPAATVARPGWLNESGRLPAAEHRRLADLVRTGLAGTLRGYTMTTADGTVKRLEQIDYAGQPAGYASQPTEVVNYVENHDNQTLFDIQLLKLPRDTTMDDRARVQVLGVALTAFSQGVAYLHAGVELMRSKSGDRNSFDSGDWFNRIDWTARDNGWGAGLPPKGESGAFWPLLKPLLADPALKPAPSHIAFVRDASMDLLRIRAGTTLLRLQTADEVTKRLRFFNTGPAARADVMLAHLDGRGLPGAGHGELVYAVNAGTTAAVLPMPGLEGRALELHPVHRAANAADPRPAREARWDAATATITVPPRTALAFVGR